MDSREISTDGGALGPRLVGPMVALFFSIILIIRVFTSLGDNPVAELMRVAGISMLILACVAPRKGIYGLLIACAYLDLIKRIAYYYGSAGDTLQYDVLSFAPMALAGTFLGVMLPRITVKKRFLYRHEVVPAAVSVGLIIVSFLVGYRNTESVLGAITNCAAIGAYTLLLIIVPELFKTRKEIEDLIERIFYIFLPCALWGIYQGIFGYPDLDRIWLASPLTLNGGLLLDVKARAFGTLASPHPFTIVYWMIIFGVYLYWIRRRSRILVLVSIAIYVAAFFFAYARSTWVTLIATLGAIFFFQKAGRTLLLYGVAMGAFVVLVVNADNIDLGALQQYLPITSDTAEVSLRLGTFGNRLIGFHNWTTDPKFWTPFGRVDDAGVDYRSLEWDETVHDQIGQILSSSGIAGLLASFVVLVGGLSYFHRRTWRIADKDSRRLAIVLLSMVSIHMYFASLAGSSVYVFPWNCIFWFVVGCLLSLSAAARETPDPVKPDEERTLSAEPLPIGFEAGHGAYARLRG